MGRVVQSQVGHLIAAWAEGNDIKIKNEDGKWVAITPDNLHGQTSAKEWVTLREAIERWDAAQESGESDD